MRFGHQDLFRLLGRDPEKEPLTAVEYAVFLWCIQEHVQAEFSEQMAKPPTADDEDE